MWTIRRIVLLSIVGLIAALAPWVIGSMWENLDASQIMVVQAPLDGSLAVYTEQGVKYQGFGTVTKYPRRKTFAFDREGKEDRCKHIQFNDGGKATLCGSVQWEMPLGRDDVIRIHKAFNSADGVESSAVSRMLDAALYLAGPLMTSIESMAEKKAELVQVINDQAENGVYVTRTVQRKITDASGTREVAASEIVIGEGGRPKRQQGSILGDFKIALLPMSINRIQYDKVVEDQIAERQKAQTAVQLKQADAQKAIQEKITIEAQGEAKAADAKWKQETIAAQAVTEARQKLDVATLAAKEAEQYKREQILRGEGDAQRKKLVLDADGALDQRLEAWKDVNFKYAGAIEKAQPGAWTPSVVMGGANSGGVANAQSLVELLTATTARQIGLDLSVAGKATVKK